MAALVFYAGPLVAWMLVIFHFSTGAGTTQHSQGAIESILSRFDPLWLSRLNPYLLGRLDYVVRKAGHVTEYFVLALLLVRAIRFGRRGMRARWILATLVLCVAYAATDEFHQIFVAGRTASWHDVMLDSAGASAGAALTAFLAFVRATERWILQPSRKTE